MKRTALIIAHGQPSDPEPAEAELRRLSRKVQAELPDFKIRSATLAAPDALRMAVQNIDNAIIFPLFMADGWFVRSLLPRRLAEAGAGQYRVLTSFGLLTETLTLSAVTARNATCDAGWALSETTLILAAHGSGRSPYPANAARATKTAIRALAPFADIRIGYIEEAPSLTDAARAAGPKSICLPLFVAHWGHVTHDIPTALAAAGYTGMTLPPLGTLPEAPGIIARAINQG